MPDMIGQLPGVLTLYIGQQSTPQVTERRPRLRPLE